MPKKHDPNTVYIQFHLSGQEAMHWYELRGPFINQLPIESMYTYTGHVDIPSMDPMGYSITQGSRHQQWVLEHPTA